MNYIADQIADHLITVAKKKNKTGTEITRNNVCVIGAPSWSLVHSALI